MFNALSSTRLAAMSLVVGALALYAAPVAHSQTIDISLNVFYDNPSDVNSGGIWQIAAKSSSAGGFFGIAGINVHLTNVNSAAQAFSVLAPRGTVNGSDDAGFTVDLFDGSGFRTLSAVQIALAGEPGDESAFYGVGTLANGDPGEVGPVYTTLTNVQGAPWGTGDPLGNAAWNTAALLASGTFGENVTPGFTSSPFGSVFDDTGSATVFGNVAFASMTTIVRTNFVPGNLPGDYNDDGIVDAADYVAWRKNPAANGGDPAGYNTWRENFAEGVPGAGGGGAVPEPASTVILVFALIAAGFYRRGHV